MVIRYADVLTIITTLGDEEKLQVTVREAAKGGLIAGGFCTLGGLLLGPPGLALGGAVGGCLASYIARDNFKPVAVVILYEMKETERQHLVDSVRSIIQHLDAGDAIELLALVQGNAALKAKIVAEMTTFFRQQLSMQISAGA